MSGFKIFHLYITDNGETITDNNASQVKITNLTNLPNLTDLTNYISIL